LHLNLFTKPVQTMKNLIKHFIPAILLTISVFSINSCRSDFSLDEIDKLSADSLNFEGSFAAPIVNSELTLLNFLPDNDSTLWAEVDENGLVHLRMYYKDMFNPKMEDIYNIPYPASAGTPVPADSFAMQTDTSKMKVYDKLLSGKLFFQNPSITFHIDNYIPIVTFFRMDTLTFHQEDGTALTHTSSDEFTISAPVTSGTFEHTDIVIDTSVVPVLAEVFAPVPKYISFYLSTGSHDTQTLPFNVTGTEEMNVDVDIDLPLDARLDTIIMSDTTGFDIFNDERIKSVTLKVKFGNGFPVDAISQIYLTDTTATGEPGIVLDSVFTDTGLNDITDEGWHLEAAETDAQGIVTIPYESTVYTAINQERVQNLIQRHASKLIVMTKLNTYESYTGQFVKILGNYTMDVQIAVKVDFNVDTNN